MNYDVNNVRLSYQALGEKYRGPEKVLLDEADDLTANTSWQNKGLTIEPLFSLATYKQFADGIRDLITRLWQDAGLAVDKNFPLDQYHAAVPNTTTHLRAIEKTRLLNIETFPFDIAAIEQCISGICNIPLHAKNPFDGQSVFHFRIIRPNSGDNNPLHRDVWLPDYKNCINLYIPVAGSNEKSSLIILPGSHLWRESRIERTLNGAMINGSKFNVPAVTAIDGEYSTLRPDPKENEVLIFSPYLIHGGSVNLNTDKTRISIEMRLWRK